MDLAAHAMRHVEMAKDLSSPVTMAIQSTVMVAAVVVLSKTDGLAMEALIIPKTHAQSTLLLPV